MIGFDGTCMNRDIEHAVLDLGVGGLILFSRNIVSPEQAGLLCAAIQELARKHGKPPLFIAVDQEGGQVARFRKPFTEFPGNPFLQTPSDAGQFADIVSKELRSVGINMNFAPVVDCIPEGLDGIMAGRVFRGSPERVGRMGATVIDGFQQNGLMAVAKHFPGIGRTVLDSHLDLPRLDSDRAEMERTDLVPFVKAIEAGVSGIMLSHILYTAIDPLWPASLSGVITRQWLRQELGYQGLVMTDDLDMGAVARHYPFETAVLQAAEADVDLMLICHRGPKIDTAFGLLETFAKDHPEKSAASLKRIADMKSRWLTS